VAIHRAATSFDDTADAYERGRPGYPADAVAFLVESLAIGPGATVVDLAAGTGKLTRALIPRAGRVVAVEPLSGMRAVLRRAVPGAEMVAATAERTGLAPGSAHACTVGQAFHWFDGVAALAEIHRLLVPSGRVGLVWNRRDVSDPLQAELDAVIDRHRGSTPSLQGGAWRAAFEGSPRFGPLAHRRFPFEHALDADGLVDRVLSVSYGPGSPRRNATRWRRPRRARAGRS
jgi:ubiquinone/menaquinone biosynthesis C-methylase UbiE